MNEEMIEQMQQSIRLECLKIAMRGREGHPAKQIIAEADQLAEYVKEGKSNG